MSVTTRTRTFCGSRFLIFILACANPSKVQLRLALLAALTGGRRGGGGPQVLLEESEDALVLVGPTVGAFEGVVFDRVGGELPVLFAQLDESFGQADGVLEVDVHVDHAVADEERALQPRGEVDGRTAAVRLGVVLRLV